MWMYVSMNLSLVKNCNLTVTLRHSVKFLVVRHTKVWKRRGDHQDYLGFYTLESRHMSPSVHGLLGRKKKSHSVLSVWCIPIKKNKQKQKENKIQGRLFPSRSVLPWGRVRGHIRASRWCPEEPKRHNVCEGTCTKCDQVGMCQAVTGYTALIMHLDELFFFFTCKLNYS